MKAFRVLSPVEVLTRIEALSFEELAALIERTAQTRGDAAYTAEASRWFHERSNTHEHQELRRNQK